MCYGDISGEGAVRGTKEGGLGDSAGQGTVRARGQCGPGDSAGSGAGRVGGQGGLGAGGIRSALWAGKTSKHGRH